MGLDGGLLVKELRWWVGSVSSEGQRFRDICQVGCLGGERCAVGVVLCMAVVERGVSEADDHHFGLFKVSHLGFRMFRWLGLLKGEDS